MKLVSCVVEFTGIFQNYLILYQNHMSMCFYVSFLFFVPTLQMWIYVDSGECSK